MLPAPGSRCLSNRHLPRWGRGALLQLLAHLVLPGCRLQFPPTPPCDLSLLERQSSRPP